MPEQHYSKEQREQTMKDMINLEKLGLIKISEVDKGLGVQVTKEGLDAMEALLNQEEEPSEAS